MGLTGGPNTFNFAMCDTLSPVLRVCAVVFFDDILIFSKTLKDHFIHLEKVLSILLKKQWRVKLSKCDFAKQEISYLGHVISSEGVSTDASKIATIKNWPVPTDVKQVRGFLGLTGYYRKFIRNYGMISRPLTDLLKKGAIFVWTPATEVLPNSEASSYSCSCLSIT